MMLCGFFGLGEPIMRLGALGPASSGRALPFAKTVFRERAVSVFRLITAAILLASLPLTLPLAGEHGSAFILALMGYALSSLVLLIRLCRGSDPGRLAIIVIHVSDVVWPCVLCLFTGCLASPFLFLMVFALLAAPYRRTVPKATIMPAMGILVVLAESALVVSPAFASLHFRAAPLEPAGFAVRAAILLVLGAFLTYSARWTEREQQAYAVQSILQCMRSEAGIQANLREVLPVLVDIFGAKRVVLVLRNSSALQIFQWGAGDYAEAPLYRNVPSSREACYFWPMPLACWSLACSGTGRRMECFALDRQGKRVSADAEAFRATFGWDQPFRTLLTTTLQFGSEWSGRIFVLDPACAGGRDLALRLLHRLADEVGPALYNFYLWQHTSARVRGIERRRLARDLHDGMVQSLIATEIQLDVLRRRSLTKQPVESVSETVLAVQNVLREEVRKLRNEIDRLRSCEFPQQARRRLTNLLENFQCESGITARFVCDVDEDAIPLKIGEDLVRVVEEALSNVRRHSDARTVEVRLTAREDAWEVVIQDDGRGFDFSGCLSLAQLEAVRKGPQSIRERVQSANGDLILESHPDRGASLKIRLVSNF
jgi:signal transduction histidine kinase